MDKEAIERIAKEIQEAQDCRDEISPLGTAGEILKILEELDYHKFPQGKPPLLSNEEIEAANKSVYGDIPVLTMVQEEDRYIAQAQREADIKFYAAL